MPSARGAWEPVTPTACCPPSSAPGPLPHVLWGLDVRTPAPQIPPRPCMEPGPPVGDQGVALRLAPALPAPCLPFSPPQACM